MSGQGAAERAAFALRDRGVQANVAVRTLRDSNGETVGRYYIVEVPKPEELEALLIGVDFE